MWRLFRTSKNLVYCLEVVSMVLFKKIWGNRRKGFCSDMWEKFVWGRGCLWKSHETLHVWRFYGNCWIHLGEYLGHDWLNFITKRQKYTPFSYSWLTCDECKKWDVVLSIVLLGIRHRLDRWISDCKSMSVLPKTICLKISDVGANFLKFKPEVDQVKCCTWFMEEPLESGN